LSSQSYHSIPPFQPTQTASIADRFEDVIYFAV
jgi:hypothetical protein